MRNVWLIARREYSHFVMRRGFVISILIVPVWVLISALLPVLAERAVPSLAFSVIDLSGGNYVPAIDVAIANDWERGGYDALAAYREANVDKTAFSSANAEMAQALDAYEVGSLTPNGLLSRSYRIEILVAAMQPHIRKGAPPFSRPPQRFVRVDPDPLRDVSAEGVTRLVKRTPDPNGAKFAGMLVLREGFGSSAQPAEFFGKDLSDTRLFGFLRGALTDSMRTNVLIAKGLSGADSQRVLTMSAWIDKISVSADGVARLVLPQDRIRSIAPLALSGLLFFVAFLSSTMLLGSVIDDKSNRVVEVMLSCVEPHTLMTGKLIGAGAAAMTIVLIWGVAAASYSFLADGKDQLVNSAILAILTADYLPLALLHFIMAFLIYCSLFLIAGSLAKSPQDAQAYVGPMMLVIMLPFFFVGVLVVDPNGWLARLLSFVPLYAPFILMMRLASDPPILDVLISTGIAAATAWFLIWLAARVYERNAVPVEAGAASG
jgi:ABC-2 type transport system permease protein